MGPRKLVSVCSALLMLTGALLSFPPILPAQSEERIRVLVVPVENVSNRSQLEPVASTVTDTIILTLRLLDRYEVIRYGGLLEFPPELDELSLLARSAPAENILYGAVSSPEAGATVELRVYDRLQGREVLSERATAATLLDIFEVADELSAEVVSAFSGRRIAFGSLRLIAQGATDRPYQVYLDGNRVGRNRDRIDSVLTGTHLLRIVAETERGEEEVYNNQVAIEEGGSVQVRFDIPDYTDEEIAAAAAAARMERDLEALLKEQAALEEAWAAVEAGEREEPPELERLSLALEVVRGAERYPQPERMRTTAREPILFMADRLVGYGREQLADAELTAGADSFRELTRLGAALPPAAQLQAAGAAPLREIDDYYPETAYVAQRWNEEELHTERRFASLVGVGLTSAALFLAFDYGHPSDLESEPLYNGALSVPLLAGAGATALWLGWDHDAWGDTRSLERYGRRGNLRDGEFLDSATPGKLDLGVAIGSEYAQNARYLDPVVDPGIGAESPTYTFRRDDPDLRIALYWQATRRSSIGLHYRLPFGEQELWSEEANLIAESDPTRVIRTPMDLNLTWDHTRTGKWFTRLGLGYTLFVDNTTYFSDIAGETNPEQIDAYYDELLDDGEFLHAPNLTVGLGRFYGRGRRSPFEATFYYRIHALFPPTDYLGTPTVHHALGLSLGKRIPLTNVGTPAVLRVDDRERFEGYAPDGEAPDAVPGGAGESGPGTAGGGENGPDGAGPAGRPDDGPDEGPRVTSREPRPDWEETFPEAAERAEARYGSRPLAFYADLGGFLTFGPRFGAEYDLGNGWTVGGYLRWAQYGAPYLGLEPMPDRVGPGVSVRRYPAGSAAEGGWYYGGSLEYRNNNYLHELGFEDTGTETIETRRESSGQILALLAEGGYRFSRRGGRFIDVGAFFGGGLGRYEYLEEEITTGASPSSNSGGTSNPASLWAGITLTFGTAW